MRISENEILTTSEYVRYNVGSKIRLAIKGEGLAEGSVRGYDEERNIALVTFESTGGGVTTPLSPSSIGVDEDGNRYEKWRLGDEIALVGYMPNVSETTPIAAFGRIGLVWNIVPGDYLFGYTYAPAGQRMYGGAVFNRWGDLIGIKLDDSSDGSVYFLTVAEIGEVIDELRAGLGVRDDE